MSDVENLISGTFEMLEQGRGYLRRADANYSIGPSDIAVPRNVCEKFNLRGGELIEGRCRRANPNQSRGPQRGGQPRGKHRGQLRGQRGPQPTTNGKLELADVVTINGRESDSHFDVASFESLTPVDPDRSVKFETTGGSISMRVVDLMTPIGFGQRGLIAAPPRTGKTMLLQQMAHGIATNHPDAYMMVLLIDERPEEVTEMRRTVHGEVVSSSNDADAANHVRIARLMTAKAKRMVESGTDVIVLLDSLTRLGRAFNTATRGRGRTMSGGLDISALTEPKAIFGAARNIEGGGSLTIIASALIETGSRMDDVIFSEFKGTGNMEIMLSRNLANMRVWPAIDLEQSGTRKEELLLSPEALQVSHKIRRTMIGRDPRKSMEELLERLGKHPDNTSFVNSLKEPEIRRRFSR